MFNFKINRIISLILATALVAGICPLTTNASTQGDFQYELSYGNAVITGYTGSESNVVIPEILNGYYVVEIGGSAFANKDITSVTLHQNISSIGVSAFYNCSSLHSVNFADGGISIEPYAFSGCTALTSLEIPYGVVEIDSNTFDGCSSLGKITLPETLVSVRDNAFRGVPNNPKIYFDGWEGGWYKVHFMSGNEAIETSQNITFATPCIHSYNWWEEIAPSCMTTGLSFGQCKICYKKASKDIPPNNNHHYTFVYDTPIDCIKNSVGHEECKSCGKLLPGSTVTIPAEGHDFSVFVSYSAPTYTAKGKTVYDCMWCNYQLTIYEPTLPRTKLSGAKITVSDKTYTGKSLKPSPTVTLGGKKLKKNTDYTVSYKDNKKIGTATVTIKGKGKYTGTRKVTFKIKPKKTTLSSAKSNKKKCITVKWKKNSTASGYQISVATNKKFTKSKKTVTAKKSAKTTTIKKLKSKKTYYVRVRAYRTVKGKKIYGSWSSLKKVKVK